MHIFNASRGEGIMLDALLDAIDTAIMRPLKRDYQPRREVDVDYLVPDSTVARTAFDWHPGTSLEQGLQLAWKWFANQP